MKSNNRKRLPYGSSDFESIRTEKYAYVDKTRYIELLEWEDNNNLLLVRPRKFGKSLFFSMLTHYYDVCSADKFESLFGDLYIGKHPTPKHNELMVINFNFSGIDTTSQEGFMLTFTAGIRGSVRDFIIEWLMNETGVDPSLIPVDMKQLYDGYMFNFSGKHSVYNSSMMLFFFSRLLKTDYKPEQLIDDNLKMDYGRLRMLLSNEQNREQIIEIAGESSVNAEIVPKFSLDKLHDSGNFISLLFYLGLVTVDDSAPSRIKIPNQSIRVVFWEYLEEMTREMNHIQINTITQATALHEFAYNCNPKPFLDFMVNDFLSKISYRDLMNFDEKYIKFMMMSRMLQSSLFRVISEPEFSTGYANIRIERGPLNPPIPYEWIWELKYVKTDGDKQAVAGKFAEAFVQLERYRSSHRLAGRGDVRYLAVVFIGKERYEMKEL